LATIRDVAQLAGVSTATVSHVLNGTRVVSDLARDRVLEAMGELHYQPNAVARSLRVSATLTIGLIVPDVEIPFFARVARCMEIAANEAGYSIILCNSDWSFKQELRYLDNLVARRVDGLICISLLLTAEHIAPLLKRNIPVVWFEQKRSGRLIDSVIIDNFKGAYQATLHLIAQGHRRIGCITGLSSASLSIDRLAGYRQALQEHGIAFDERLICSGDYTPPTGLSGAKHLLALPEPPSAIFAYNDMMALGAMQAINERGLRVPDDIAVIGFDGIALTEHTCPPLSTVEQPIPEMSKITMNMLLDRINNRAPHESRTVVVEPHLICRSSTLGLTANTQQYRSNNPLEVALV
jgi:LacI family transcriptional regulator